MQLLFSIAVAGVLAGGWANIASAQIQLDNRRLKVDPSAPASKEYERSIKQRNREALEGAKRTGGSHVDTTFGTMKEGERQVPEASGVAAEEKKTREPLVPPVPRAQGADAAPSVREAARNRDTRESPRQSYERPTEIERSQLPELIGELLKVLDQPPRIVRLTAPGTGEGEQGKPGGKETGPAKTEGPEFPRIEPGSGFYARVLYTVDSDHPGPVLLQILEPPLAGAVASGSFQRVRDRMVVRLGSVSWRGRQFPVEAWAVGLDCACYGLRGDVDRHWWERLILPAAVNFAEGFLTARGRGGRRVEVSGETVVEETSEPTEKQAIYAGLGNAVRSAGEILLQDAPGGPTVRIPRDAEVAVVFARPPGDGVTVATSDAPDSRGPPYSKGGIRRVKAAAGPTGPAGAGERDRSQAR